MLFAAERRRLAIACFVLASSGCELLPTTPTAPVVADTTNVPPEVMNLTVFAELNLDHPNEPLDDLMEILRRSGIRIARLPAIVADVKVDVTETRTVLEETSQARRHVVRNGVLEHIRRVMDISHAGQPIDQIVVEWNSDTLSPTKMPAATLANAFLSSPNLAAWARTKK